MFADIACQDFMCQNGGVCVERDEREIVCLCPEGFIGSVCENSKL